jgi:hypothetical protein
MMRATMWMLVGLSLLCTAPARTSPVDGPRQQDTPSAKTPFLRLLPGTTNRFTSTFAGNERACVIVVGDHDPVMKLVVKVYDSQKKLVREDSGGDVLAVIWYPPHTEEYTIEIHKDAADPTQFKQYNDLYVVVK